MADRRRAVPLAVLLYLMTVVRQSVGASSSNCAAITLLQNTVLASSSVSGSTYVSGDTVTLECSPGYAPNSGTSGDGTCSGNGGNVAWSWGTSTGSSATPTQLVCSPGCNAPTLTSSQQPIASASAYAVSSSVTISCITGYTSSIGSSLTTTCGAGYTWSPSPSTLNCQLACQPITLNSQSQQVSPATASSYTPGTKLTLACNTGYIPTAGTAVNATCSNGQWTWGDGNDQQLTCFQGCNPPEINGISITPSTATYAIGASITIKCGTGYTNTTSGRTNATCNSTGVWLWTGNGTPVTCVQTCTAPSETASTTYNTSASAVYIIGSNITAQCASGYSYSSGSYIAYCSAGNSWTWKSPGALVCLKKCTVPTLSPSLKYVSSQTATYLAGNKFTIGCNTNYAYYAGNESAVCSTSGSWTWNGGSQLTCIPTCTPPVPGAFSSATPTSNQTLYLANQTVTYVCDSGYIYASGGTTGTCISVNTWAWSNAATVPQVCIAIPMNMGAIAGFFSNGICNNYVLRPAITDATCLLSCTYDDYCNGYSLVGTSCYHERPQLASAAAAMSCLVRY